MIRIESVNWANQQRVLSQIRYQVFVEEQQVPVSEEIDQFDPSAHHYLVWLNHQPVGCARMVEVDSTTLKIGRFAILRHYRRKGIGHQLLNYLIETAIHLPVNTLILSSQYNAIGFYQQKGFEEFGERFMDAGIEHIGMQLVLEPGPNNDRRPKTRK